MLLSEARRDSHPWTCSDKGSVGDWQRRRVGRTRNCYKNVQRSQRPSGKATTVSARLLVYCASARGSKLTNRTAVTYESGKSHSETRRIKADKQLPRVVLRFEWTWQ